LERKTKVIKKLYEQSDDLEQYDYCAIGYTNEMSQVSSGCSLKLTGQNWELEVNNAQCKAVCFNLEY
jgi:hypothetical protein